MANENDNDNQQSQQDQQNQQTQQSDQTQDQSQTRQHGGPQDILDGATQAGQGGDDQQQQQQGDDQQQQQQQDDQQQSTSSLTKEDMVEILKAAGLGQSTQQTQQTQARKEPEWTQAQWEEAFKVWKPDAAFLAQLRHESPDEAMKALVAMRDAVIRQAMTMADYRMQQIRDQLLQEHIQPVQAYVSEAQATSFVNEFFTKHPDLKQYEVIVDAVANKLQKEGFQGKNRTEVMKRFADDTRAVVAQLTGGKGGTGKGAANGQQQQQNNGGNGQQQQTNGRRMSTLSNGGQGGQSRPGAGTKQSTGNKNIDAGLAIFD